MYFYEIAVPKKLNKSFYYKSSKEISEGCLVLVNFNNKLIFSIVLKVIQRPSVDYQIKEIDSILPFPPIKTQLINFVKDFSSYYLTSTGKTFALSLLRNYKKVGKKNNKTKNSSLRDKVKNIDKVESPYEAKISYEIYEDYYDYYDKKEDIKYLPATDKSYQLNDQQLKAYNSIKTFYHKGFNQILLDGKAGSGKTNVYFEAVFDLIKHNYQILILLPEIGLANEITKRFNSSFNIDAHVWHSKISTVAKRKAWLSANNGSGLVYIGTRSSLFLPFKNLALIIVDEEHDQNYKQEQGVIYHARDAAILRAKHENIPCLLVSASPSLETIYRITDQSKVIQLKDRFNKTNLANIEIVDMKNHDNISQKSQYLSKQTIDEISNTLHDGQQALLFLNRRGYANLILCKHCGYRIPCPNCSSWLVHHKQNDKLICHICDYQQNMPSICPNAKCSKKNSLVLFGLGIEKLAEEVCKIFPSSTSSIISSDFMTDQETHKHEIDKINSNTTNIILGSQMIAKGYDFKNLTLVVIVDCDYGFLGDDFRSSEKNFQLLLQVAGRSGRWLDGKVIIQSWRTDNPIITALVENKRDSFVENELFLREKYFLPPYCKMALIIIASSSLNKLTSISNFILLNLPKSDNFQVFGPSKPNYFKVKRKYRLRFLVKAKKNYSIQKYIKACLEKLDPSLMRCIKIDIDPYYFD